MDINNLLNSYPRIRPPLGSQMAAIYEHTYKQSRTGKGMLYAFTQKLESWMHHKVAKSGSHDDAILELGAGTLNHVPYEVDCKTYDVVEPFTALYADSDDMRRIDNFYRDITEIPVGQGYSRILSVAVLEHIVNLPECIAHACMLLKEGGIFQAGIPSEGGFLWGFSWRASVGLNFRVRTGLDYGELMRHEHINDAREIIKLIEYFFDRVIIQYFPFPHLHGSLYMYVQASAPRRDRCIGYLQGSK